MITVEDQITDVRKLYRLLHISTYDTNPFKKRYYKTNIGPIHPIVNSVGYKPTDNQP